MRMLIRILILLFVLLPIGAASQKQPLEKAPATRTFAVIIGVADYAMLPKLQFSDKDALEFYLYLRKVLPADSSRFSIFLNKNASRNAIANRLYQVTSAARAGDKVFIYFSGHGDIEQLQASDNFFLLLGNCASRNYMASSNSILEKYFFDYYVTALLAKKVKIIFICDACHAGKLIGGEKGRINNSNSFLNSWSSEIKLLSCQPDQTSLESTKWGEGRSLFSYYLVLGLKGLADKDKDGKVSLDEINQYLNAQVKEGAKSFNLDQWPTVMGNKDYPISKTSDKLLLQASLQNKQNSSSDDYKDLATEKGKKVKVGSNIYVFKSMPGMQDGYLQMENNFSLPDKYLQSIYFSFKNAVNNGNLVNPDQVSAYYYYSLLKEKNADSAVLEETRILLLNALVQSYDDLLADFYDNRDSIFYNNLAAYDTQNLAHALELSAPGYMAVNQLKSKQLFLQVCKQTRPSAGYIQNDTATRLAIPLLLDAVHLDSLNPSLYSKLGQLYMAGQQYKEALDAYTQYQQMLPNDAHIYNSKGLIYLALQQDELAAGEFTKALQLDAGYEEARANLLKTQQKKQ